MSRKLRVVLSSFLCAAFLLAGIWSLSGAEVDPSKPGPRQSKETPGVELARTLSVVTGVAISPLLGVGAVGAYHWWRAEESRRPSLPWYAQPWFWVPALLLVTLAAAKDILGTTAPGVLKKPFDVAEAIENKLSGLIAAGAFVPLIISVFPEANGDGAALVSPGLPFFTATINAGGITQVLATALAIAIFATVWLTSHSINMLILISPFSTVDAALKGFRFLVLLTLTALSFLSAYIGAIFCLLIVFICYWLAGWSFRLTVFGTTYLWDFVSGARHRFKPLPDANVAFTAIRIGTTPARSFGRLYRDPQNSVRFVYRPWGILKARTVELPSATYFIGRGLIHPEITQIKDGQASTMFLLPPRCRTHEEELARTYQLAGVRDVGLLRGLQAVRSWVAAALGRRSTAAALGQV